MEGWFIGSFGHSCTLDQWSAIPSALTPVKGHLGGITIKAGDTTIMHGSLTLVNSIIDQTRPWPLTMHAEQCEQCQWACVPKQGWQVCERVKPAMHSLIGQAWCWYCNSQQWAHSGTYAEGLALGWYEQEQYWQCWALSCVIGQACKWCDRPCQLYITVIIQWIENAIFMCWALFSTRSQRSNKLAIFTNAKLSITKVTPKVRAR